MRYVLREFGKERFMDEETLILVVATPKELSRLRFVLSVADVGNDTGPVRGRQSAKPALPCVVRLTETLENNPDNETS